MKLIKVNQTLYLRGYRTVDTDDYFAGMQVVGYTLDYKDIKVNRVDVNISSDFKNFNLSFCSNEKLLKTMDFELKDLIEKALSYIAEEVDIDSIKEDINE